MCFPRLVKLHSIVLLYLERKARHLLDQLVKEVSHVFTIIEQHIPVLSVGKIVIAQIGPEIETIIDCLIRSEISLATSRQHLTVHIYS